MPRALLTKSSCLLHRCGTPFNGCKFDIRTTSRIIFKQNAIGKNLPCQCTSYVLMYACCLIRRCSDENVRRLGVFKPYIISQQSHCPPDNRNSAEITDVLRYCVNISVVISYGPL